MGFVLPDEVLETRRGNTDKVRSILTALVAKNGQQQIDRQYRCVQNRGCHGFLFGVLLT